MKADVTKRLVQDGSVGVAWWCPEESSPFTEKLLDMLATGAKALAPAIWPFEVANGLLSAERRKRLTVAQVTSVSQRIALLPITVDPPRLHRAFGDILSVARQQKLT